MVTECVTSFVFLTSNSASKFVNVEMRKICLKKATVEEYIYIKKRRMPKIYAKYGLFLLVGNDGK